MTLLLALLGLALTSWGAFRLGILWERRCQSRAFDAKLAALKAHAASEFDLASQPSERFFRGN